MKKKIGDLTLNEIKKIMDDCEEKYGYSCIGCPFENVDCSYGIFEHFTPKDLDLNQEVEIEEDKSE